MASSYKARHEDPQDDWRLTVQDAVRDWNQSLRAAADFRGRLLVVEYEGLFIRGVGAESLFDFLDLSYTSRARLRFSKMMERSQTLARDRVSLLTSEETEHITRSADFDLYDFVGSLSINSDRDS